MRVLRTALYSVLVASVLTLAAAAEAAAQDRSGIVVVVDNYGFPDTHLYVIQSGQRHSLGVVTGLSRDTLRLPRIIAESERSIRILSDPIGGSNGFLTELLVVSRGEQINLTLENNPRLSRVTITEQAPRADPERSSPER